MKERRSEKGNKFALVLKNVSVIARLTVASGWSVGLSGESFRFAFKATRLENLQFDPYVVREKFLGIETPQQALTFFKRFGPLDLQSGHPGIDVPPGAAGVAPNLSFQALLELQSLYQKVLTDPKYWAGKRIFDMAKDSGVVGLGEFVRLNLLRPLTVAVVAGRPPYLLAESAYVSQAIYATLYIDWLSGLRSIHCPICHKVVRQKNQHFQRFCSERCGRISRKKDYLIRKGKLDVKA